VALAVRRVAATKDNGQPLPVDGAFDLMTTPTWQKEDRRLYPLHPLGQARTWCYPCNRVLDGTTDDGSPETLLTNMVKKKEEISGLESPSPQFRGISVHVLLLFLASTFFALWINVPCPLDPLLTYCKLHSMHGTQRLTHFSQLR
jgi:hypothetical protein